MIQSFPKIGKVKKTGAAYKKFKNQVHEADNWCCRICVFFGRHGRVPLTVSHMIKRSKVRLDIMENCISACLECHTLVERSKLVVTWIDAQARTISVIDIRDMH